MNFQTLEISNSFSIKGFKLIELKKISKNYGKKCVLSPISFNIQQGQTHVLLGSSGCGKTTILRIICGLTKPDQGEVFLDGKNLTSMGRPEVSKLIGYVIQEGGLFPHLNALDNILLPAKVHNADISQCTERMYELAKSMDLLLKGDDYLFKKFPNQLSGGQRQRMALIRALILNPKIVLMDEPLSALDPLVRQSLKEELKDLFSEMKKTVVLVTHDLHTASFLGNKISLLNGGEVMQEGYFSSLRNNPKNDFVRRFVSSQMI